MRVVTALITAIALLVVAPACETQAKKAPSEKGGTMSQSKEPIEAASPKDESPSQASPETPAVENDEEMDIDEESEEEEEDLDEEEDSWEDDEM
jgi:hypothetical protein